MSALGRDERNLEIKVGAMILVALVLLVTFILILGDWSWKTQKELDVMFENPGGLLAGAAVKVAGKNVGRITEMTFLGQTGPVHPISGKKVLVRARIAIDEEVYNALRNDVRFYVTTKGVLGDPFLEIDPGVDPNPLDDGKVIFGVDPPRLDMFLADAYQLVRGLNSLLERNAENLDTLLGGTARLVGAMESMVDGGVDTGRIDSIVTNVGSLVEETQALVVGARKKYVDDPTVVQTLKNLESLSGKLDREIDPMLAEIREALSAVDRLSGTIGPAEQAKIKTAIARLDDIMMRADQTLSKVGEMVDHVRRGEGTVGQLMVDEEIYDDLKELIRDIKRHPWKIIWEK